MTASHHLAPPPSPATTNQPIDRLWKLAGASYRLARLVDSPDPSTSRVQMAAARVAAAHALAHHLLARHPDLAAHDTAPAALSILQTATDRLTPQTVALLSLAHDARAATTPELPVNAQLALGDLVWEARALARNPGYFGVEDDTARAHAILSRLSRRATVCGLRLPPAALPPPAGTAPARPALWTRRA